VTRRRDRVDRPAANAQDRRVASFAGGKIEAFVGPTELGAADDLETVIVDFVGGARSTLDIAVQELDSEPIAQAILDARWRGVQVNLFLEQDYLKSPLKAKKGVPIPPRRRPGESKGDALRRVQWGADDTDLAANRRILAALLRSGIEVKGDFNPKIFHQKFVLRDYRGGRATKPGRPALLSGSANFTYTDTHRNLNHVFVFHSPNVCRQYELEFDELRVGRFGRQIHGDVPKLFDLAGIPTKVLFAPEHTPELEIMKQMLKGSKEVWFAIFTFSGSSGIDDAMVALARSGIPITGVLDRGQSSQGWAAPKTMNHPNISLFRPTKASGVRKLHHKLMVIDERTVVAGSFNYTKPANDYNDENIFVLGSVDQVTHGIAVSADASRQLALYMKAEITRIIDELGEPYAP
jgi:phosphatidylserine/phosphatidylglycerophosphate/cardiolipin synthase-like enzyme